MPAHGFALLLRVDTPSQRELIAANNSIEEIREFVEADSLAYLALDSLAMRCMIGPANFVMPATRDYPTLIQIDEGTLERALT